MFQASQNQNDNTEKKSSALAFTSEKRDQVFSLFLSASFILLYPFSTFVKVIGSQRDRK